MTTTTSSSSRAQILQLASETPNNDGVIVDFDDGHVPENFKGRTSNDNSSSNDDDDDENYAQTKLVRYPSFVDDRTPTVYVLQEAVPTWLADALYHVTANVGESGKPWGTYVTVDQVDEFWIQQTNDNQDSKHSNNLTQKKENLQIQDRETLAVAAASFFFQNALELSSTSSSPQQQEEKSDTNTAERSSTVYWSQKHSKTATTTTSKSSPSESEQPPFWTTNDQNTQAHGVAVWALASTEKAQVPYHLDYGEQIRYEHNLIVPPLLAGTLQCTPTSNMEGGTFCVCMDGLEHYEQHGYKGGLFKKKVDYDYTQDQASEWIEVPYRYNQMIVQSGHLPHLSTSVVSMEPLHQQDLSSTATTTTSTTDDSNSNNNSTCPPLKRVILGFNVFGYDYGPMVQQAPEHSDVFRRKVTLQRMMNRYSNNSTGDSSDLQQQQSSNRERVSLQAIHANKGLSKLLVLAKREKVKHELRQAQQKLDQALEAYLLQHQQQHQQLVHRDSPVVVGVTVEELMSALSASTKDNSNNNDASWPTPVDVQVHINQRLSSDASSTIVPVTTKENASPQEQHDKVNNIARREHSLKVVMRNPKSTEDAAEEKRNNRMVSPTDIVYLASFS